MKALSLTQPWASLCVLTDSNGNAEKQFETRGFKPTEKMMYEVVKSGGRIAIQSALKFPKEALHFARTNQFVQAALNPNWFDKTDQLPLGAIIGTVELVGVFTRTDFIKNSLSQKEVEFGDYSANRWAWTLRNPMVLKTPIPCKGALSLWEVPKEIEQEIYKQI